jgi:hypothetical protein
LTLPPIEWPAITLGPDLKPTYPSSPDPDDDSCETATAEICTYTESYGVVVNKLKSNNTAVPVTTPAPSIAHPTLARRDTTTATTTVSFCTSVTGCGATDITETTTDTSQATAQPHIIHLRDPHNPGTVAEALAQQVGDYFESRSDALGTLFFYVPHYTQDQVDFIETYPEVDSVYIPVGELTRHYWGAVPQVTSGDSELWNRSLAEKRAQVVDTDGHVGPEMTCLSWPPNNGPVSSNTVGEYRYDDSAGFGTFIYDVDYGYSPSHRELEDIDITPLFPGPNAVSAIMENDPKRHGTKCIAKAAGKHVGVAKRARVFATVFDYNKMIFEIWLDALVKIHEDIRANGRGAKSVVNLSISIPKERIPAIFQDRMGMCWPSTLDVGEAANRD